MRQTISLRSRVLDRIYAEANGRQDSYIDLVDFINEVGADLGEVFGVVQDLTDQGLLRDASTMGGPCAALTSAGVRDVEGRLQRRHDPVLRRAAARRGLLRWFYAQDEADVHMPITQDVLNSPESLFEGDQLSTKEIERAAEFLAEQGFIDGISVDQVRGPVRAKITSKGEECVEHYGGDVAEYMRNQGRQPSITTHIGNINSTGALAVGSTGVTQRVTVGLDPATLASLAKTLLAELEKLPLPARSAENARTALAEVAEAGDDQERAVTAFERFVGYLVDAGKPVVTAAMMLAARHYGLPPT